MLSLVIDKSGYVIEMESKYDNMNLQGDVDMYSEYNTLMDVEGTTVFETKREAQEALSRLP